MKALDATVEGSGELSHPIFLEINSKKVRFICSIPYIFMTAEILLMIWN